MDEQERENLIFISGLEAISAAAGLMMAAEDAEHYDHQALATVFWEMAANIKTVGLALIEVSDPSMEEVYGYLDS